MKARFKAPLFLFEKPSLSLFPLIAKFKWRKNQWYVLPTGWRTIRHFITRSYIADDTWEQAGFMVTSEYTFTWMCMQIDFKLRIEQKSESIVEVKTIKMPRL